MSRAVMRLPAAESKDGVLEPTIPKPAGESGGVVHIKPTAKAVS